MRGPLTLCWPACPLPKKTFETRRRLGGFSNFVVVLGDLNLCVVASNASVQASEPFFRERAFFKVAEGLGPRAGLGDIPL